MDQDPERYRINFPPTISHSQSMPDRTLRLHENLPFVLRALLCTLLDIRRQLPMRSGNSPPAMVTQWTVSVSYACAGKFTTCSYPAARSRRNSGQLKLASPQVVSLTPVYPQMTPTVDPTPSITATELLHEPSSPDKLFPANAARPVAAYRTSD
eukprot:751371-Hanusia_phi.AAC.1